MALLRKLQALGYPHADGFNLALGGEAIRNLVVWLEDTKICHYPIEKREPLRQINDPGWEATFGQWAADLGCPHKVTASAEQQAELLDWVLGHAVLLEYSDNASAYGVAKDNLAAASAPVAEFDLSDESIRMLADLLKLPPHDDTAVLLQAIAATLNAKFNPIAVSAALAAKDEPKQVFPLDSMALGFSTGDDAMDRACKVLRLLHITDLRDLQTRINELIVKVQSLTADPKTNIKLGKVGR